jgi:membrane-bound ClpP family serine protease
MDVLAEINGEQSLSPTDRVRRKYLKKLSEATGRNVIAYYSGWLYRDSRMPGLSIGDDDKNGFMTAVHKLDRSKGLDLILHTPGGSLPATESLVDYLRAMFGTNLRAIVPQLAMSAGTMMACACHQILMGKESSLGPIDPQLGGVPARGVLEEFEQAAKEVAADPSRLPLWQTIIGKYHPTFLGECRKACDWSEAMVQDWLATGMLKGKRNAKKLAQEVAKKLSDHGAKRAHSRHLSTVECESAGLNILKLEDDDSLQDLVLTVHHAYIHTFSQTPANKIIENQNGVAVMLFGGQPNRT